jgi:hypothetical protein
MLLQSDENKIKTFLHHPFPFFVKAVKIAFVSFPFFFVASFFQGILTSTQIFFLYSGIGLIFLLIIFNEGLLYFFDRIVVTNKRIVHVDWISLFKRVESEADLKDIQDIKTSEFGIFSAIPLFDYGSFEVETASSKVSIIFKNATDPEGIKHFVYHLQQKHSRIMNEVFESPIYDRTYAEESEEAGITRRSE